ncbi:MAG: acyl-CoA dehydrogenase family protein [Myxococcota bacterium]
MAELAARTSAAEPLLEATRAILPLVRELAARGEVDRHLPQPLADAFNDAGIFRMCRPRALGGLEVDPITVMRVVEQIAQADGAAGWCAMISGSGSAFDAFIPPSGAARMYADPRAVTTGVLAPTGRAVPAPGGFRVTGRWAIASNCKVSDWLGGSSVVFDGAAPKRGVGGMPEVVVPMLASRDCTIHDTWRTLGLRGTGSHDFEATDVFVPADQVIRVPMVEPYHEGAAFTFPFLGLLAASIASVALGIGRRAVDELVVVAKGKTPFGMSTPLSSRPSAQLAVADAEAALGSARAYLFDEVQQAWDLALKGRPASPLQRAHIRLAATHAVASAARAVDLAYTTGGASAMYERSPLQRAFRDVHAITQHFTVAAPSREVEGRALFGLDVEPHLL